jgi:hypothetical protein
MTSIEKNDTEIISMIESLEKISSDLLNLFKDYSPILNGERYISEKQLSDLLHICSRTLQDYRTNRYIPYICWGGKVLYKETDIKKMLAKKYVKIKK